ncbi:hypothetical protein [Polymorphobacter multimanifer]|nr:hypothetical protein [Polymorphobacter multimanifer]
MIAIASEPVDNGADDEVGAKVPGKAIKLVNVAFLVTNVNTPVRLTEQVD